MGRGKGQSALPPPQEKNKQPQMTHTDKLVALLTNNDDDVYCFRKELLEALVGAGYRLLISCPYGEKFELLKHLEYEYDDPDIDRRGTNPIKDLGLFLHYRRLFRRYRPFVVLTYTAKPNVYAGMAARSLGIPYICNVTGLGSVLNKGALMRSFILALFRFAYRGAACVMFQNATNQALALEKGMVKGEHKLVPGSGVDTTRYPVQDYPEGGDGTTGAPVVFNYIGRILHDKGVDDYLEAAKTIKARHPNTEFNLLGFIEPTEMQYKHLLEELEGQGIIRYHGSQKDIRPFLARSHATIHPSTYGEGMSNVLLESAASGRPLITTDNPGCRETVLDKQSGFIYHGGNLNELCDAIELFLALDNSSRRDMGLAGRRYVEANFSRQLVIDAYLKQIASLEA